MIRNLRARLGHPALGPALVIWGFGYVLVAIFAYILGRAMPGLILMASLPMLALGVGQTLALDSLRQGVQASRWTARWMMLALAVLTATAIQALFDLYWMRSLSITLVPQWQEWALIVTAERLFTSAILYLWTFSLALTLIWAARSSADFEASSARAARAETAAARAEAAALRLQLNPHFLFNTLNSIGSLVQLDRKEQADEMINQLCDFLRASLSADPMADVPLAEEIETIDAYLAIEAARFGDRLDIEIEVEPEVADTSVPSFILQPLVENAIKHGVARSSGAAMLEVKAGRVDKLLVLSVINSATGSVPPESMRPSTGIGLPNIRQRLANRFGGRASLETDEMPGRYRAVITLPLAG